MLLSTVTVRVRTGVEYLLCEYILQPDWFKSFCQNPGQFTCKLPRMTHMTRVCIWHDSYAGILPDTCQSSLARPSLLTYSGWGLVHKTYLSVSFTKLPRICCTLVSKSRVIVCWIFYTGSLHDPCKRSLLNYQVYSHIQCTLCCRARFNCSEYSTWQDK